MICETSREALKDADALAVVTECQEFRSPDFDGIRNALSESVIFDGRNLYDPTMTQSLGFTHYAVGRGHQPGADNWSDGRLGTMRDDSMNRGIS